EPSIRIPNQLVGAPLEKEVLLECLVEASPRSVNYWTRENGDMIISSAKYEVLEVGESYQVHFKLKIRDLEEKDFGSYNCISKNLLGEAEGQIRLHEIDLATVKHRLEPKDSYATDGTEDLVSSNLTLSNQKGLDSYKHSLVNQLESTHMADKSRLSARPNNISDRKYSEIFKDTSGKKSAGTTTQQPVHHLAILSISFSLLTVSKLIFL
uniref:Ig-like domain-containing protein n=1 Tax=Strigamia maritima TaxID=126957 RepID=T1IZW5_STRMM